MVNCNLEQGAEGVPNEQKLPCRHLPEDEGGLQAQEAAHRGIHAQDRVDFPTAG